MIKKQGQRGKPRDRSVNQIILQCIALGGLAWYLLFYYVPYYGLTIAFKDYKFNKGILGSPWVGLKYFRELLTDISLPIVIRNTVCISLLKILICFPAAILFALLLNEIPRPGFKKVIQTISYFPHFISWIIISLIAVYMFSPEYGMVNHLLMGLGLISQPLTILTDAGSFYWLAVFSELWKETGWSSILFIAAISGIDPTLYEAAVVDGASRWDKILHITLPSITGTITLVFLLNFSNIFAGVGGIFEQSMFLGNPLNYDRSIVLGYYTLKTGIALGRFSYATAVGFVNGVVSLILLLSSNAICHKFFGRGLYTGGSGT
jgi:putative aldouronate transport system permease protein